MYAIQVLINGVLLGGVYALLGLGMTILFGIIKLTNLAHGEFIVLGAYLSAALAPVVGIDPLLTLLITVPLMFLLGFVLQYCLIGKAMEKGAESALLVTFGISIVVKDALLLIFSADVRHIPASYAFQVLRIGSLDISVLNIVLFAVSFVSVCCLQIFLNKTPYGRAIRAIADDAEAAKLCGVHIKRIYALAMGLSLACAAVAGLCIGMKWTFYPTSGSTYLLISFVVVVIGGMSSIRGTFIAGIVFGLAQVVGGANYGLLISYILVVLLLILKPKGIARK